MKSIIISILLIVSFHSYAQITVNTNFLPNIAAPMDLRQKITSLADTSTITFQYLGAICYVETKDSIYYKGLNGWKPISAGGGGGSSSITDLTLSGASSPYTLNSSDGTDVTIAQGTGIGLSRSSNQLTITNSDPDQTVSIAGSTGTYPNFTVVPESTTVTDGTTIDLTKTTYDITAEVKSNSIDSTHIKISGIGTTDIADGVVKFAKLQNSGVTASTYNNVTVNNKGIVTNGSNVSYLTTEVDGSITNEKINSLTWNDAQDSLQVIENGVIYRTKITGFGTGNGTVTSVAANAGTGISVTGSPITSSGTLTITNTAPDQTVAINGYGITNVTGTYPNFAVTSTEVDGSTTNELSTLYYQAAAPVSGHKKGDIFYNTSLNTTSVYTGSAWTEIDNPTITSFPMFGSNLFSLAWTHKGTSSIATRFEGGAGVKINQGAAVGGNHAIFSIDSVWVGNIISDSLDTITTEPDSIQRIGNVISLRDGSGSVSVTDLVNVATDLTFTGASSPYTLNSSDGTDVTIAQGTGIGITRSTNQISIANSAPDQTVTIAGAGISAVTGTYPNFTVTSTEVDGLVDNEGKLSVGAGGANSSSILSNSFGSNTVTIAGSSSIGVSETGNTITITNNIVDSTTVNAGYGIDVTESPTNTYTIKADTNEVATPYDLTLKQNTLVSGTNIKTVNGNSLLGSGNVTISTVDSTIVSAGTGISVSESPANTFTVVNTSPNVTTNLTVSGTSSPLTLNSSDGTDVTITAGTNVTLSGTSGNITINASGGSGTVTSIATTSPITGGTITSTGTIGINDAAADGTTKGAASFAAADFNATTGNISIDYTNGQAASSGAKGFLTSTDWNTFNGKYTLPSLTSGSVLFSNGSTIAQDNTNFFWNDASNFLGIGTSSPSFNLHVAGSSGGEAIYLGDASNNIGFSINSPFFGQRMTTSFSSGWARSINTYYNMGSKQMEFGAYGDGSSLTWGYIAAAARTYTNPNLKFFSNGKVSVGVVSGGPSWETSELNVGGQMTLFSAYNQIIGHGAGNANFRSGSYYYNDLMGYYAGGGSAASVYSQYLGYYAGHNNTGHYSVIIGNSAGYNNTGTTSVLIGNTAGYYNTRGNSLFLENTTSNSPLIGGQFDNRRVGINTDISSIANTLHVNGGARITSLAGSGSRMVVADGNGDLATQAIPSAISGTATTIPYYNTTSTIASSAITYEAGLPAMKIPTGNALWLSGTASIIDKANSYGAPGQILSKAVSGGGVEWISTSGLFTEVDGLITNEGYLGVTAGSATSAVIQGYNSAGTATGTGTTVNAGTGLTISETTSTNGGQITLSLSTVYGELVQATSALSLTTTATKLIDFQVGLNNGVTISAANDRMTIVETGIYSLEFNCNCKGSSSTFDIEMQGYKNGSTLLGLNSRVTAVNSQYTGVPMSRLVSLTAGDYIEIWTKGSSASGNIDCQNITFIANKL